MRSFVPANLRCTKYTFEYVLYIVMRNSDFDAFLISKKHLKRCINPVSFLTKDQTYLHHNQKLIFNSAQQMLFKSVYILG
jgi:hypothetical protein